MGRARSGSYCQSWLCSICMGCQSPQKGMHSGQEGQAGGVGPRVNTTSSDASGMMDWGVRVCVCVLRL